MLLGSASFVVTATPLPPSRTAPAAIFTSQIFLLLGAPFAGPSSARKVSSLTFARLSKRGSSAPESVRTYEGMRAYLCAGQGQRSTVQHRPGLPCLSAWHVLFRTRSFRRSCSFLPLVSRGTVLLLVAPTALDDRSAPVPSRRREDPLTAEARPFLGGFTSRTHTSVQDTVHTYRSTAHGETRWSGASHQPHRDVQELCWRSCCRCRHWNSYRDASDRSGTLAPNHGEGTRLGLTTSDMTPKTDRRV